MFTLSFLLIFLARMFQGIDSNSLQFPSNEVRTQQQINLQKKAQEALRYCKQKRFNTDFCILIDMGIHSGKKRFFVWDFKKQSLKQSFLVGHGCCSNPWNNDASKSHPRFSNEDGSHCSSLGKYKIGARGKSAWGIGINYLLHGLEKSNSNALKRAIVLHSWHAMPDEEIFPDGAPEGWGCPTLSNASFLWLDPMLSESKKPVLLWIFVTN